MRTWSCDQLCLIIQGPCKQSFGTLRAWVMKYLPNCSKEHEAIGLFSGKLQSLSTSSLFIPPILEPLEFEYSRLGVSLTCAIFAWPTCCPYYCWFLFPWFVPRDYAFPCDFQHASLLCDFLAIITPEAIFVTWWPGTSPLPFSVSEFSPLWEPNGDFTVLRVDPSFYGESNITLLLPSLALMIENTFQGLLDCLCHGLIFACSTDFKLYRVPQTEHNH